MGPMTVPSGCVVPPQEGTSLRERGKGWGSEESPKSPLQSWRSRAPSWEGAGAENSGGPPRLHVPTYLLNAQEPDILPYDLLWGELEGTDSGEL